MEVNDGKRQCSNFVRTHKHYMGKLDICKPNHKAFKFPWHSTTTTTTPHSLSPSPSPSSQSSSSHQPLPPPPPPPKHRRLSSQTAALSLQVMCQQMKQMGKSINQCNNSSQTTCKSSTYDGSSIHKGQDYPQGLNSAIRPPIRAQIGSSPNNSNEEDTDTNEPSDCCLPKRAPTPCLNSSSSTVTKTVRCDVNHRNRRCAIKRSNTRSTKYGQIIPSDQAFVDVTLDGGLNKDYLEWASIIDDFITIESKCERLKQLYYPSKNPTASHDSRKEEEEEATESSEMIISYTQTHKVRYKDEIVWKVVTTSSFNGKQNWGESSRVSIDGQRKNLRLSIIKKGAREVNIQNNNNNNLMRKSYYNNKQVTNNENIVNKHTYCLENIINESAKLRKKELGE